MKNLLIRYTLAVSLFFAVTCVVAQQRFGSNAKELMTALNKSVVGLQNADKSSADYGGVWCSGCGLYHTRAAEALFPLAYEYSLSGDKQRLGQAIALGNWLIGQQKSGGEWVETPEEWTGTTTDQLLMMLLAYPIVQEHLTKSERQSWLHSMELAGDYLARVMNNKFASINYCATTTATLAQADKLIPKKSYRDKASELAHMIVAKMNPEHFIEGEGSREDNYKYGIDIGYNMEMSLWGLARYAQLTGDAMVADAVEKALANHIWFIYPNGVLDGSSGIRSNKWTMYGSGTSDGCHPLLALYAHKNPAYGAAAIRNIEQINASMTKYGLIGTGPHYDKVMSTPPCIYPTFTKAKSMAMAMSWLGSDSEIIALMPTDTQGYRHFVTMNVLVARTKNFCGTVTAYNYKAKEGARSKYMHRPSGGSVTALWVDGFDMLQASSQNEYNRWEPMSFPELPEVKSLTPRIEVLCAGVPCSNLYEYDASFNVAERGGAVEATTYGQLKSREQKACGIAYTLQHRFESDKLAKYYEINHQTADDTVRIIEPILLNEAIAIKQIAHNKIEIKRNGKTIVLTMQGDGATMRIDKTEADKYWGVYPALKALPIVINVPLNATIRRSPVTLTYQIL